MQNEKSFKTKTGFCHILPEKIVLTRDGIVGNVSKVAVGNGIARILIIYSGLAIALFYFAYNSNQNGQSFQSIIYALIGVFLVYGVLKSINNSATPVIERSKIKKVRFKKSIIGITRSRFEVLFETENGKIRKRLIMLPGSMTNGQTETEKALKVFTAEKLIE